MRKHCESKILKNRKNHKNYDCAILKIRKDPKNYESANLKNRRIALSATLRIALFANQSCMIRRIAGLCDSQIREIVRLCDSNFIQIIEI